LDETTGIRRTQRADWSLKREFRSAELARQAQEIASWLLLGSDAASNMTGAELVIVGGKTGGLVELK
jgi:hypothetical protein